MGFIKIHQQFKLNGKTINKPDVLLKYVEKHLPGHYGFLISVFDNNDNIIAQTSGSTGQPKKIKIRKKYLINSALKTIDFFELPPETKALLNLSSTFIAGKMMWIRALTGGWHLDVISPKNKEINKQLTTNRYDFGAMVPFQVIENLDKIHKIDKLIIGGGQVSNSLQEKIQELPNRIFATYGMTETITHIAVKSLNKAALKFINQAENKAVFYKILPGISISTDDRNCLIINAPALNEKPVITNDLVEIKESRFFKWLGRYDNIINSGGVKIMPEQVEEKLKSLLSCPFFVAGLQDDKLGEKVVLLIETKQASKTEKSIKKINFNQVLSKYEIPKEVYFINSFKYTESGKLQRESTLSKLLENI